MADEINDPLRAIAAEAAANADALAAERASRAEVLSAVRAVIHAAEVAGPVAALLIPGAAPLAPAIVGALQAADALAAGGISRQTVAGLVEAAGRIAGAAGAPPAIVSTAGAVTAAIVGDAPGPEWPLAFAPLTTARLVDHAPAAALPPEVPAPPEPHL